MQKIIDFMKKHDVFEDGKGLDTQQINALNEQLGYAIPDFFVSYLSTFGLNFNYFNGVYRNQEDFIEENEMIQELGITDYIAIGDSLCENLIVAHKETQQLWLIEDDIFFDLGLTFTQMLFQSLTYLEMKRYGMAQQITDFYEGLQGFKTLAKISFTASFKELKQTVSQNQDSLYGVVITRDSADNSYSIYAGGLATFRQKIQEDPIDYHALWKPEKMCYKQALNLEVIMKGIKEKFEFKALELLILDVLRELDEQGYFSDQLRRFSISIQCDDVSLFVEDSYNESLMKENDIHTQITRFWESPYDRTRLLMEVV